MTWECDKPDGRPCRIMETRACPVLREIGCAGHPCARYESEDEEIWAPEMAGWWTDMLRHER